MCYLYKYDNIRYKFYRDLTKYVRDSRVMSRNFCQEMIKGSSLGVSENPPVGIYNAF